MHVLISIHKTVITLKELTFAEVKFMFAALQEKMLQIIQHNHMCREGAFSNHLTIVFQLQLESKSVFIHMSINAHNKTIHVYLFLKINLTLDLYLDFS